MEKIIFRDLLPEEIEVRVGNTTKDDNGKVIAFNLMLYKTARVDAIVLDETVGCYNWQKKFYQVKNTMVCSVGIYSEERNEWIWKDDGGDDDTTMEQVKAELSDSFKRAGFAWGIGRKLYSASKIYMRVDKTADNNERAYYQVKEIEYDEKSITKLVIINKKTKQEVISYGTGHKVATNTANVAKNIISQSKPKPISEESKKFLIDYVGKLGADTYKKFGEKLNLTYGVYSCSELNEEQAQELIGKIKNGK